MHFCGNPFHDSPLLFAATVPIISGAWVWIKVKFFSKKKKNKCGSCKGCSCKVDKK